MNYLNKQLLITIFAIVFLNQFVYSLDFYWVGGTGKWSELAHWAPSSGEPVVRHDRIPTSDDNVIFDVNSFPLAGATMQIDVGNAFCKNMDWTGCTNNPTAIGTNNLIVLESLTINNGVQFDFSGNLYFEASPTPQSLTTVGSTLNCNIYFSGSNGTWNSDITIVQGDIFFEAANSTYNFASGFQAKKIYHRAGTLNLHNFQYSFQYFASIGNLVRQLNSTTTKIITGEWIVRGTNYNLNLSQSNITVNTDSMIGGNAVAYNKVTMNSKYLDCVNCTFDSLICNGISEVLGSNTYNYAMFLKDATFLNSNNFNQLLLTDGYTYILKENSTQTIDVLLDIPWNCDKLTYLSSSGAAQANLVKNGVNFAGQYLHISKINASGTVFVANNSIDNGNNSGWIISQTPRTLYWVGGTGYWDENIHWSATSGGAGGECLPKSIDHVIFDENSFSADNQTVTVRKATAECLDFRWTNLPYLVTFNNENSINFNIYGSILLDPKLTIDFSQPFYFRAKTIGKTVKTQGVQPNNHWNFAGSGSWELLDDLNLSLSTLYLTGGEFYTKGKNISAASVDVDKSFQKLDLENSTIMVNSVWANHINYSLLAGTSHIMMINTVSSSFTGGLGLIFHNVSYTSPTVNGELLTSCIFNKVTFAGNGKIGGNMTYDSLIFSPNKTYNIQPFFTQTIKKLFSVTGNCDGNIIIKSESDGYQTTIIKSEPGNVLGDYLILKDIIAQSPAGATFTASNSIDLGNNTGWNIQLITTKNLFWVGGTGNWSDPMHWASTSGGTGGLSCLPTLNDNVIFDEHSFTANNQTVNVDVNEVFCKDMNWTGAKFSPAFSAATPIKLMAYGDLIFINNMNFDFNGTLYAQSSDKDIVINPAGHVFPGTFIINGKGGVFNLAGDFENQKFFYIQNGTLQTNDFKVNVLYDFKLSPALLTDTVKLDLGNSVINIGGWSTEGNVVLLPSDHEINIVANDGSMNNDCRNSIQFNKVNFTYPTSTIASLASSIECIFNQLYFASHGQVDGYNTIAQLMADKNITLNQFNTIDSAFVTGAAYINGHNEINYIEVKGNTRIETANEFGKTELYGTTDVYGTNFFHNALFYGDANLFGTSEFDTLNFSPNKHYFLEGSKTQKVNKHFNVRGNKCYYIYLKSNSASLANISMPAGEVIGDYIEMKSIKALGGASFYAGVHSIDQFNSNQGWNWNNQPGYIYGFPSDSIFILGDTAKLSLQYFNGDPFTKYLWSTGDTLTDVNFNSSVRVWAKAIYGLVSGSECSYSDTANVYFVDIDSIACHNQTSGKLKVIEPTLGKYTYRWSNPAWTNDSTHSQIENLHSGTYRLEITDQKDIYLGKTARNIQITEPSPLAFQSIQVTNGCGTQTPNIQANVTGGTQPYRYQLDMGTLQSGNIFRDLNEQSYKVSVLDTNECTLTQNDVIVKISLMKIDSANATSICFGQGSGKISIYASSGQTPFSYALDNGAFGTVSVFSGRAPGKYVVRAKDVGNCIISDTVQIFDGGNFTIHTAAIFNQLCSYTNDGLIDIELTDADVMNQYQYDWSNGKTTQDINQLSEGTYKLKITDRYDCEKETDFIIISPPQLELSVESNNTACNKNEGSLRHTASGGTGSLTIEWTDSIGTPLDITNDLKSGKYFCRVLDQNGCVATDSTNILDIDCYSSIDMIPNVFTPNGDGINDMFKAIGQGIEFFSAIIYNQWGRKVFEWEGIENGWDGEAGIIEGKSSQGTYYYLITAKGVDGKNYRFESFVHLYR